MSQQYVQALVHAHQQAQIAAGIYKGDGDATAASKAAAPDSKPAAAMTGSTGKPAPAAAAAPTTTTATATTTTIHLTPAQAQQLRDLKSQHEREKQAVGNDPTRLPDLLREHQTQLNAIYAEFRNANNNNTNANAVVAAPAPTTALDAANTTMTAAAAAVAPTTNNPATGGALLVPMNANPATAMTAAFGLADPEGSQDSNSPAFQAQLRAALTEFWSASLQQVRQLRNQTEQDFKNHNDLPLARIKRIMKSDEDVRMISAEAPVLLAKACELFILDLSIRAFNYSQLHKRRTLQKEDVKEAIQKTDVFDFLVDVIL